MKILVLLLAVYLSSLPAFGATYKYVLFGRELIETRLKSFSRNDTKREIILKDMFTEAGCGEHISEPAVDRVKQPDLVCVLPGQSERVIIVGAHFDHVDAGDGLVDNWSGASLLPTLYQGLRATPRQHTFIFASFSGEEKGEIGSRAYVNSMSNEDVKRTSAIVNMDTLGLGPTEVWTSHSDRQLTVAVAAIAQTLKLPISGMNVERVGSTDSEQFARKKIPSITIHSLTQDTLHILHSPRDNLSALRLGDYYDSYHLIAAYLAYLDTLLDPPPANNTQPLTK
ncbi:MAG TPA: M28 family peptidase [Terriglobales bacterium]|nr:M28 family peptidase [Terriglobales bacterium]